MTAVTHHTEDLPARRKDFLVHYLFYEPVEQLFYKTLRAHYPEMTVADIVVCRAVYIDKVISGGEFKHIVDRRDVWSLYNTSREEWARYVLENKHLVLKPDHKCDTLEDAEAIIQKVIEKHGIAWTEDYTLFQTESSFEEAIGLACGHVCISYTYAETRYDSYWVKGSEIILPNPKIILRDDIIYILDKTTEEAVQTEQYVSNEQLLRHEQEQAELDRRHTERLS